MQASVPGRRVTRLAKVIADVTWWFTIVGAVVVVVVMLISPVLVSKGADLGTSVHVSIPDEAAAELLPLTSSDTVLARDVRLDDVEATLHFKTSESWPLLMGAAMAILAAGALLLGLHLVRSLLRDVLAERVFTATNARRLSRLGWLMIAAGFTLPILEFLYTIFMVRRLDLEGVPFRFGIDSIGTVIPGLLVLVVAAAWRFGVELQQDHDLTV